MEKKRQTLSIPERLKIEARMLCLSKAKQYYWLMEGWENYKKIDEKLENLKKKLKEG